MESVFYSFRDRSTGQKQKENVCDTKGPVASPTLNRSENRHYPLACLAKLNINCSGNLTVSKAN